MLKWVFVEKNNRDSNMELLRIVAMVLIMVLHADFASISVPTIEECHSFFFVSFSRFFIEGLSVVAVNTFVLLSGWYGIKPAFWKFCSFIFQTVFLIFFVYCCFLCIGKGVSHSWGGWLKIIFANQYWFVQSYIILYVFSPVLNAFVENNNKQVLKWILISLFLIQFMWGYLPFSSNYGWYNDGYSPLTFFFLYLLARYVRLYSSGLKSKSVAFYLTGWLSVAFLIALLAYMSVSMGNGGCHMSYLYGYSSPLVVLGALMLLLTFARLSIKNQLVNWLSASAFSVYIVHCHECVFSPLYCPCVRFWFYNNPGSVFFVKIGALFLLVFVVSIIIDKVIVVVWQFLFIFLTTKKTRILINLRNGKGKNL